MSHEAMTKREALAYILTLIRRVRSLEQDLRDCQEQRDRLLDEAHARQLKGAA